LRISFQEIDKFDEKIQEMANLGCPILLAGNCCKMEEKRNVTTEQGRNKAQQHGWPFLECSAKKNLNIAILFEILSEKLVYGDSSDGGNEGMGDEKD
jgi:GTPase SAR1 family protein